MKAKKVVQAAAELRWRILSQNDEPFVAQELTIAQKNLVAAVRRADGRNSEVYGHLLWMLDQIPVFLVEDRREKAMRWLGFAQGMAYLLGEVTIEDLKRSNMPDVEIFDARRGPLELHAAQRPDDS